MRRIILCLFVLLSLAVACRQKAIDQKKEERGLSIEKRKQFVIGFSQCTFEDPWRINMNREMEESAKVHPELKLIISNGENRNAKQIADVENFMVMGIDLLIISPREAVPLTAVVEKAFEKGIPVIVLDRKIMSDKYTMFIGASNLEIGREAGKYIAEKLNGKGNIVEIEGILGATPTHERSQGFHEVIDSYPSLKVIYKQPGDYKRSPARQVMENALSANDKIDAVYAHNDEMAIGAYLAAKAVNREKGIIFVGIDGQKEAVDMIRRGELSATFVYPNGAKEAIEYGLRILNGERVEKDLQLPTLRITKDEALDYKGF